MPQEMMTTREVARYLGIHEKQVYALIKAERIPATRITGKWIFPKNLIDEWIDRDARKGLQEAQKKTRKIEKALLASGSNDPILDMLQTSLRQNHPEFYIFSANTGSIEGLRALNSGYTDIAWSHLLDPESGDYNVPYLSTYVPNLKPVVVNLFRRKIGLVLARDNPMRIKGFEDLTKGNVRFVNRQPGSGTRLLLDHHLKNLGISAAAISGYEKEVYTHFEVGLAVLANDADAGLATIAIAKLFGLPFIPVTTERFDMILSQQTYFEKGVQAFFETLRSEEFKSRAESIAGYEFNDSGRILYSSV
jgi:putative molybdopterin biosynthesis protein